MRSFNCWITRVTSGLCSPLIAKDKNNIWLNKFVPIIQDWKEIKDNTLKALDVGCNMGILVEGANNEGFDVRGVDINRLSIEVGKKEFPKIADRLSVDDFTQPQSEENA